MKIDWAIYYDDGTRFTNEDGEPRDAPRTGVEIVVQFNPANGYDMLYTVGDYFVHDPERGGWRITDLWGVNDHLIHCRYPVVLFGRNMNDAEFRKLRERVEKECGKKSGWLARERQPIQP